MQIGPSTRFIVTAAGRRGFSASLSASVGHDAAAGPVGVIRTSGAQGPVVAIGILPSGAAGNNGGLFTVTQSGQDFHVSFDRAGLGTGLEEGASLTTGISVTLSDGQKQIEAPIRISVVHPLSPPVLVSPIPDQLLQLAA